MQEPNNRCPVDWARYNEHMQAVRRVDQNIALIAKLEAEALPMLPDFELDDLLLAVRRAASELEGQGEKSDRIATQLLTALGRFEAAR